jgi:hypothetical protein
MNPALWQILDGFNLLSLVANGESAVFFLPGTAFGISYQERTGASATTPAGIGDPVGTYRDLITLRYIIAPSDAARPVNRGNYFVFDGTDDVLDTSAAVTLTQDWSAAAASVADTVTGSRSLIDADNDNAADRYAQFIKNNATTLEAIAFNTAASAFTDSGGLVEIGKPYYVTAMRSSSGVEVWKNGVSNGTTATTGTAESSSQAVTIGANRSGALGAAVAFFDGDLYGALYLGRLFTQTERVGVDAYLKAKVGLA